jgi:TPR repeat protein
MGLYTDHRRRVRPLLVAFAVAAAPVAGALAAVGEVPRIDISVFDPEGAKPADPLALGGADGDYLVQLKTFSELEDRATRGDVDAQWRLGLSYYRGIGTPENPEAGFEWLTRAAEKGNPTAASILGSVYQRGLGTPVDHGKAVMWFQKGADAGIPMALYQLGVHAMRGWGVPVNREHASTYFKLAHDKGMADGLCAGAQLDY